MAGTSSSLKAPSPREDFDRALELLNRVILGIWDQRFPEIELFAIEEANQMLPKAKAAGVSGVPLDSRLMSSWTSISGS